MSMRRERICWSTDGVSAGAIMDASVEPSFVMNQRYLFVISPPYSGSTVLWRLLQTSNSVSALPDEGQKLPELRDEMRKDPWDPDRQFDWDVIKKTWHEYWDNTQPILLEKSPPHLCRSDQLAVHFKPASFILLLRDPLATCEGLFRRNGLSWEEAAERWKAWLAMHLRCRETLEDHQVVYYEDMTDNPSTLCRQLSAWVPALADVDWEASVEAHAIDGQQTRSLINLNAQKIDAMGAEGREAVIKQLRQSPAELEGTPYAELYL